jgi:hypothetical protein
MVRLECRSECLSQGEVSAQADSVARGDYHDFTLSQRLQPLLQLHRIGIDPMRSSDCLGEAAVI